MFLECEEFDMSNYLELTILFAFYKEHTEATEV